MVDKEIEQQPQRECKIKNAFHETDAGCYIIMDDNNELQHVYNRLDISTDSKFRLPYEFLKINWKYKAIPYFDNCNNAKLLTHFSSTARGLEHSLTDALNYRAVLHSTLEYFHETLMPKLKYRGTQYYLPPAALYDLATMGNDLILMKPVKIISDKLEYYRVQRDAFFEMLEMFCKTGELKRVVDVKDLQVCGAHRLTSGRYVPPELKCGYNSASECIHIVNHTSEGKTMATHPRDNTCHYLIQKMIVDHGEEVVTNIFKFKCCFVFGEDTKIRPVRGFNEVFERVTNLHRLCIPEDFIGDPWYNFLVNDVIKLKERV